MTNVRYGITNGMARKPDLLVEDTEKKIIFNWDKQSHEERWKDSEASAVIFQTTWKIIGVHNDNHPSHNLLFGRRGRAINKRFVFSLFKELFKEWKWQMYVKKYKNRCWVKLLSPKHLINQNCLLYHKITKDC